MGAPGRGRYAAYGADFPELFDKIHDPYVWVCRDVLEDDGPGHWTFVAGTADAPEERRAREFVARPG